MPETLRLRIESLGGLTVVEASEILNRVEQTYNGLVAAEVALTSLADEARFLRRGLRWRNRWIDHPFEWPEARYLVRPRERLILSSVELRSPGFWEFLGSLRPLDAIRRYLNDRHRRRQDREYRERIEARRGDLENQLIENQIFRELIDIARSVGATDDELRVLLTRFVYLPFDELGQLQDRGLIASSEPIEEREDGEGRTDF